MKNAVKNNEFKIRPVCRVCGDNFSPKRKAIGYRTCLPCGEELANAVNFTVVPMNKSNYIAVRDPSLLRQLNPKFLPSL
jgi:ribosomal protein L37AE/L43A